MSRSISQTGFETATERAAGDREESLRTEAVVEKAHRKMEHAQRLMAEAKEMLAQTQATGKAKRRKAARDRRQKEENRRAEAAILRICQRLENMHNMIKDGIITRKQWIIGSTIYLFSLVGGIYGLQYLILRLAGYYS